MSITNLMKHDNERNNINTYAAQNNGETQPTMRTTTQTTERYKLQIRMSGILTLQRSLMSWTSRAYTRTTSQLLMNSARITDLSRLLIMSITHGRYKVKQFLMNMAETSSYVIKYRNVIN